MLDELLELRLKLSNSLARLSEHDSFDDDTDEVGESENGEQ